jgi:pimeloyl-ACP methyl ester carboxylesterase/ketosteroid isomerase-like protein
MMRSTLLVLGFAALGLPGLGRDLSQPDAAWRDPSPHQVRWITVDSSIRLEVLDWGGSGPPLVLLGCYWSAHQYDDFAPKLTNQFHVYGVTRRGIGASDKPATGYAVQRSANDLLEVLESLKVQKFFLVGVSCAGQIMTMFAGQHSDRLHALVYFDGTTDPTISPADLGVSFPEFSTLPRPLNPPSEADRSSFKALAQRPGLRVIFPEAEWRQQFVENPDGSVGRSLLDPTIRKAITEDARMKPNYAGIRVPVLALYQSQLPFEAVAAEHDIRNEQQRAALRQQYETTRALYARYQNDFRTAVPTARIVELPGANLFMFLSNEADVLREIRAFVATLPGTQAGQALPDTQMPSAVSLPPAFDRVLRDYEAAWRDGNGPRLAALFTEDGFALQSGSPIRRGRAAIASGLTKPAGALQLTAYAYSSSGNVGYIVGGFRYPTTVGSGGRFVLALRSDRDGRWLIAADLDNSGPPMR